jgi:hypothetical protein
MPCTTSKDLATISAQELTQALVNPAPAELFSTIGTAHLQALRQLASIFDAALPGDVPTGNPTHCTAPSPTRPPRGPPHTPTTSHTNRYTTPRVAPSIVPPPRVAPTGVPSPRVHAKVDPQEDEPILGVNIFDSFEEEEMILTPRYLTRDNARCNATNHVEHTIPMIFWPISFTNIAPITGTPISKPTSSNEPPPAPDTYQWLMQSFVQ